MADLVSIREQCMALLQRLEGRPSWAQLRAIYLEIAPLLGRLQASVAEAARERQGAEGIKQAQAALETLKTSAQRVGLDIRLASEPALQVGLQVCLEQALEVVDSLERTEGR